MADPTRIFISSGLITRSCLRGYWVAFATRVTIDLQLPAIQLILLGTVMEATILVSEIPTGVVADVISRRLSVIISFFVLGGSIVMAGIVDTFPLLVVSQVLWGLGWTFQSGAETAWITDELGGHEIVEPIILRRARLQFAFSIVGMIGGVVLAAFTSLSTTIVVAGALMSAWGLVLLVVMPEHAFLRERGETWKQFLGTLRAGAEVTRRSPSLRLLAVVVVLAAFGGEALDRLDIRRLDQIGLPQNLDAIVVVGVIATLEALLAFAFVWGVEHRGARARVPIAIGGLLVVAALGSAGLGLVAFLPIAAFGLVTQGGLRSALEPLYIAWTNANTPAATRATVHSFVGQADASGEITGGLVLGWVATTQTVPSAMATSAALFAAAGVLAISRGRHRRA